MSDFHETTIHNFSGLSSETKPTFAAGNTVPNGSRWREVDTNSIYFYNLSNDTWYSMESLIAGHAPVVDVRALDIFEQMLVSLKKIEYHCMIATDTNINDQDV
jgi:hypothetical protein